MDGVIDAFQPGLAANEGDERRCCEGGVEAMACTRGGMKRVVVMLILMPRTWGRGHATLVLGVDVMLEVIVWEVLRCGVSTAVRDCECECEGKDKVGVSKCERDCDCEGDCDRGLDGGFEDAGLVSRKVDFGIVPIFKG